MCQITVADGEEPMGSLLFLNFVTRFKLCGGSRGGVFLKGTKLWPNRRRRRRRSGGVRACASPRGLSTRTRRPAVSAVVSFHTVCLSCECMSIRATLHSVCSCSGLYDLIIFVIHRFLLKNTLNNLKRMAYRKKIKVYINICVYEMTKCSRFI